MDDVLGEIELRVKLEEKKKELLKKLQRRELTQPQQEKNSTNEGIGLSNDNNAIASASRRSEPPDPEKIKQRVESIKRKAWCLGETLHMDESSTHRQKRRKFHSIPLVTPNDSSHASITLSHDNNVVQVIVKRAQPDARRGNPIEEQNIGHQLLKRLGWRENAGLGRKENGIIEPLIPIIQNNQKGLGSKTKQDTTVHNFCEVCNKIIPESSWASHLSGKKHKHRVHYVQMLEQLAPHLLPEERHQILDEDDETSKDENNLDKNSQSVDTVNNNDYNNINNNGDNNGSGGSSSSNDISKIIHTSEAATLSHSNTGSNATVATKFIGPTPRPGPIKLLATSNPVQLNLVPQKSTQLPPKNVAGITAAQSEMKADHATIEKAVAPVLAPVPLPPDGNHQWMLCDVCKIHMYPQNWDMHINGKVHQKNLRKLIAEKQIEEEKAAAHLLPEKEIQNQPPGPPPHFNANRRPFRGRGRGQFRQFRGREHRPHYNPHAPMPFEDHSYINQDVPLYPPPAQFLPPRPHPDPRFFQQPIIMGPKPTIPPYPPHVQPMPTPPPQTAAVVSMIRGIIAQRMEAQKQNEPERKAPDPSRIFDY